MSSPEVYVVTAEVRRSADQVSVVADEAGTSRTALAGSIGGQHSAWQTAGRPGFAAFIDVLEEQAARLRSDLSDLAEKLRNAADVYDRQDQEGGAAFDESVRYR